MGILKRHDAPSGLNITQMLTLNAHRTSQGVPSNKETFDSVPDVHSKKTNLGCIG